MNWPLTAAVFLLAAIGVLFVFSACYFSEEAAIRDLYKRQLTWVLSGSCAYVGFALVDYRRLRRAAWWAYGGSLALLALVLLVGPRVYGARRWLTLFGIGLQPSEIAKLATILVLARRLSRPGVNLGHVRPLAEVLLTAALPALLIVREPDLGTALVFVPVVFVMMFVAGVPLRALGVLVLVGVAGIGLVLGGLFLPQKLGMDELRQQRIMRMVGMNEYQKQRLRVFFRSDVDPLGAGWNRRQSEIAVGSGGGWGKGYLQGTQNTLGFLPRSVAFTDFVFSVIAEEKGFFGSLLVLGLFGTVLVCGLQAALLAHDKWGRLLSAGVMTLLFFHIVVNIGMTVGLLPITGLPLPLLSYGGTFMVISLSALGMVQSVHIRSRQPPVLFEQISLWRSG
jgi:rod shape determining protein RodA